MISALILLSSSMLIMLVPALAANSKDVGVTSFNKRWTTNVGKRALHHANGGDNRFLENQDPEFLIIGGTELDAEVWAASRRYLVSLANPYYDGTLSHRCTASMISRRVVLTAAHCVYNDSDGGATIKGNRVVKMNMYDYDDQTDVVTIPLCRIKGGGDDCLADSAYAVYHENYDDVLYDNDFALIFLPDISAVNEGFVAEINPVKLNSDANVPADGEELEVLGWGATTFEANDDDMPKVPNTVILQYVPDDQCEAAWGCEIFDSILCAIADGQAVGSGDSGGPIITLGAESGESVQVGVTSFGYKGLPDGFARVSHGFDWIKTTVCGEIPDDSVFCDASPTSKPTKKPSTKKPTSKPTSKPSTSKPSTGRPSTKKPTYKPTSKPSTSKPSTTRPSTKKPTPKPTPKPTTRKPTF